MTYTKDDIRELCKRYGLGITLIRKVINYYDSYEDVVKVLGDISRSSLITDWRRSLFDAYLDSHPEMRREK